MDEIALEGTADVRSAQEGNSPSFRQRSATSGGKGNPPVWYPPKTSSPNDSE